MIPTATTNPNTQSASSAMFGIASLILEGRAICDDDFIAPNCSPVSSSTPNSTSVAIVVPTAISRYSTLDSGTSFDQNFQQRLRQKLGQLRQSSPGTSRDYFPIADQKIASANSNGAFGVVATEQSEDLFARRSSLQHSDSNLYTLQALATTCLWTSPIVFGRNREMSDIGYQSCHEPMGAFSPTTYSQRLSSPHISSPSTSSSNKSSPNSTINSKTVPKIGPHCDQFLRKLGLAKCEAAEAEEHICDITYASKICNQWQLHCREMSLATSRCEPICIEVYLGPENHSILLEQWIIQQKDKVPSPNMTLQSLCNAIRSQLYFSQITSWCDLIRKKGFEDFQYTGRMLTCRKSKSKPRLDIYYRINSEMVSYFNAKPSVHNFPNVVISENCSLSVCLKSLPRINGGIPHVNYNLLTDPQSNYDELMPLLENRNTNGSLPCETEVETGTDVAKTPPKLSHREKQLLKYKKRMLKRDKKTRKSDETSADSSLVESNCYDSATKTNDTSLPEYDSIELMRPPLYHTTVGEAVQTSFPEMISTGTQTAIFPTIYPSCDLCGMDMSLVCFNCDSLTHNHMLSPSPPQANKQYTKPNKLDKGELLLQSIQRTPSKCKILPAYNNAVEDTRICNTRGSGKTQGLTNCQLCKRQKTQHNYRRSDETNVNNNNNHSNQCSLSSKCFTTKSSNCDCGKEITAITSKTQKSSFLDAILIQSPTDQFKTPTTHGPLVSNPNLKPNLLQIATQSSISHRALPKINLTQLFCNPSSPVSLSSNESPSSAISPGSAFTFDNINSPEIPVQKSNSAPALPNCPSLSPRFAKQAAIYKRRSRHLSDRSDRSSLCSDEQISDEDAENVYSPLISPIKNRTFLRSFGCGRKPLLGNLEESLLQRRFVPKSQVVGFKVLLGASGGFCPTQKTIQAATYFYELSGQTLSTPYVCEIRIPRKGYTIPRTGTVQVTLLNPDGTVVRMFVIPYDFRDMPAMHQTFIRQRILAVDNSSQIVNNNSQQSGCDESQPAKRINFENLSSGEQMQLLRYSIHLRFQTSRSGRLALHSDIRILISRRTDCDTAAAHAKGVLELPNELRVQTITPDCPKYSTRQETPNKM